MPDGTVVDLRNIRSPIVVFCSKGDNITPPQQALGWILDLYEDVNDIRRSGQTIVYTVHEDAGHLGIFVSSGVARKEHDEFSSNIDLIDTLPPGLYEAVLSRASDHRSGVDQRRLDDALRGAHPSTTSVRWAATTRPMSAASPPRHASRKTILRSTGPSCSPL